MHWIAYIELQGLYAAAHRGGGAPAGLPLVVLQDGAARDGCPLARAQGLRPGMPRRQVLRQVPGAVLAEYGTADYTPVARAFWNACAARTPYVEPLAPHQVFIALPVPGQEPPEGELGALLQECVTAAGGDVLPAAGLAASPLVARVAAPVQAGVLPAAGAAAREGAWSPVVTVGPGAEAAFLAPRPIAALWRARPEVLERLGQLGISRIGELQQVAEAELVRQFGPVGRELARWARGLDGEPVRAAWPPRAVSWRWPFPAGAGPDQLPAVIGRGARELARRLQQQNEVCSAVGLTLEREAGAALSGQRRLSRRQQGEFALARALLGLMRELLEQAPDLRCTAVAAAAADLAPAAWRQMDLWGAEQRREEERTERLEMALAAVQARFPARAARIGVAPRMVSRREVMFGYYDPYRWTRPAAGG